MKVHWKVKIMAQEPTTQGVELKTTDGCTKAIQMMNEATHFFICSKERSEQELRLPFKCRTHWKVDLKKDETKENPQS